MGHVEMEILASCLRLPDTLLIKEVVPTAPCLQVHIACRGLVAACPRKIFTERLPELVESYARKSNRLTNSLQAVGLAAGGETGTRLAEKVGMQT